MTGLAYQKDTQLGTITRSLTGHVFQLFMAVILTVVIVGIAAFFTVRLSSLALDDELLVESTLGQLGIWLADQSGSDEIESWLVNWVAPSGQSLSEESALATMRGLMATWSGVTTAFAALGLVGLIMRAGWSRWSLLMALIGLDVLVFLIPVLGADQSDLNHVLLALTLTLLVLAVAPGRITRVLGFFVVLSALLLSWEGIKIAADALSYRVSVAITDWNGSGYADLDAALVALESGEVNLVVADRRELQDLMSSFPVPEDPEDLLSDPAYPNLVYLPDIQHDETMMGLPISPEFPGRLSVVVRQTDAQRWSRQSELIDQPVGYIAGGFAEEKYFSLPRQLDLIRLSIFNDLNLPHLQTVAEALLQPARRNGPTLLVRILGAAGLYTWSEALIGFVFGASFGFLLGTFLAHSALLQRGILPYVVASQTIPILAIAPMVVIWLGAGPVAVAVIASYLTFFPVTINTLRGLTSVDPMALDLMHSFAASKWDIMWKLRLPNALPYIFTALKVSATASVVGAIIGELPSSVRNGLGRALLDFSSDYSIVSTPKLWAAIVMAALIGIVFFLIVSVVEMLVLRRRMRRSA